MDGTRFLVLLHDMEMAAGVRHCAVPSGSRVRMDLKPEAIPKAFVGDLEVPAERWGGEDGVLWT